MFIDSGNQNIGLIIDPPIYSQYLDEYFRRGIFCEMIE